MNNDFGLREEICCIGKLLYDKGMIAGTEGNISCRIGDGAILITPREKCKGTLIRDEIVLISLEGDSLESGKAPSSEYRVHLVGYKTRSDFAAAVHAHPPFFTAFAAAGLPIKGSNLSEFSAVFGEIPLIPFAQPGTEALAKALERAIAKGHTFLFENHGLISFGANLDEAYYRLEMAEHCAQILWLSRQLVAPKSARRVAGKTLLSTRRGRNSPKKRKRS